jgi:hypothetical protein
MLKLSQHVVACLIHFMFCTDYIFRSRLFCAPWFLRRKLYMEALNKWVVILSLHHHLSLLFSDDPLMHMYSSLYMLSRTHRYLIQHDVNE